MHSHPPGYIKPAGTAIEVVNRGVRTSTQSRLGQQQPFRTRLNANIASTATNSTRKPGVLRGMKVATLNTRATLTRGRLYELEAGCNKYNINVVGIQEHRRQTIDSTELEETENGGLFIFSAANDRSQGGVGLFVHRMAKRRLISYERVNNRI